MIMATLALALMGLALGAALGFAARYFAISDENPLIKEIEQILPGGQCGQCGVPGCGAAAVGMVEGTLPVTCCPPGGIGLAEKLATILGVTLDAGEMEAPKLAFVEAGECIGCTRCYKACPTDAIVGAAGQIHCVLLDACTGCGKCVDACPEDCIKMVSQEPSLDNWRWSKPQAA